MGSLCDVLIDSNVDQLVVSIQVTGTGISIFEQGEEVIDYAQLTLDDLKDLFEELEMKWPKGNWRQAQKQAIATLQRRHQIRRFEGILHDANTWLKSLFLDGDDGTLQVEASAEEQRVDTRIHCIQTVDFGNFNPNSKRDKQKTADDMKNRLALQLRRLMSQDDSSVVWEQQLFTQSMIKAARIRSQEFGSGQFIGQGSLLEVVPVLTWLCFDMFGSKSTIRPSQASRIHRSIAVDAVGYLHCLQHKQVDVLDVRRCRDQIIKKSFLQATIARDWSNSCMLLSSDLENLFMKEQIPAVEPTASSSSSSMDEDEDVVHDETDPTDQHQLSSLSMETEETSDEPVQVVPSPLVSSPISDSMNLDDGDDDEQTEQSRSSSSSLETEETSEVSALRSRFVWHPYYMSKVLFMMETLFSGIDEEGVEIDPYGEEDISNVDLYGLLKAKIGTELFSKLQKFGFFNKFNQDNIRQHRKRFPRGIIRSENELTYIDEAQRGSMLRFAVDLGMYEHVITMFEPKNDCEVHAFGTDDGKQCIHVGSLTKLPLPTVQGMNHLIGKKQYVLEMQQQALEFKEKIKTEKRKICSDENEDDWDFIEDELRNSIWRNQTREDIDLALFMARQMHKEIDKVIGQMEWLAHQRKARSVVVSFGNGKGWTPTIPMKWLKERLASRFIVVVTSEHRTSKLCSSCGHELEEEKMGKHHRLWRCHNCNFEVKDPARSLPTGRIINKDISATIAIGFKAWSAMVGVKNFQHSPLFSEKWRKFREEILEEIREEKLAEEKKKPADGGGGGDMELE
eukprot:TRINITY_DN262_c0_g1_i20.p1 TRINITY_DN262_c0_g1~~TRINITY_DN262_c0_g1_i20.p1  ORF type:complete len:831 (-),score=242.24 TRINITY_DN262_c0_g1_i20:4229-6604(-)